MTTSMRLAAAAAAAALVLGSGSAATAGSHAAGHDGGQHGGSDHSSHGNHGSAAVEHLQKQLQRRIDRLGHRIDHATRESRLAPLADDVRSGVLDNVAADDAALADLSALVAAATTPDELRDLRKQVRDVRAENYVLTVALLRSAARLSAEIAELRTTSADDADALALLDEADALLESATAKALGVTAWSSKADVGAVRADVTAAHGLVEQVEGPPAGR